MEERKIETRECRKSIGPEVIGGWEAPHHMFPDPPWKMKMNSSADRLKES